MAQQYSNIPEVLADDFECYPQVHAGDIPEVLDGEPVLDMMGDPDGPVEVLSDEGGPDEVLGRFEEGKPADPTENMSPEDAKAWESNTEKYQDKFKTATYEPGAKSNDGSGYTPGATIEDPEAVESTEGSDIPDGNGNVEKRGGIEVIESMWALVTDDGYMLGAADDYHDATSKSYWRHSVDNEQLNDATIYELVNVPEQIAAKFVDVGTPAQMFDDGYVAWREAKKYAKGLHKKLASVDLESLWDAPVVKEAAAAPTGLYGFTRGVQSDCESCTRKVARVAGRLAKAAYQKDPKTAEFFATHSKRGKSLTARVLVNALREMAPKVGSVENDAPMDKEAGHRAKGLYGFGAKTASLGLSTCASLRDEVGQLAYDLHSRKADKHGHITGFLKAHIKAAGCDHSRLLESCYPDADCKVASKTASANPPSTVEGWLALD